MHLITLNLTPYCDLIWGFPCGQQGKISSGVFAYIDRPTGTLCPKSAHTSKKMSLRTPVYFGYDEIVDIFLGSSQLFFFFFLGGGGGSFILYIYFLGLFLKVKVQNWNIFGGCYMLNIFGVSLMFLIYF